MKCKSCNSILSDTSKFCDQCGEKVIREIKCRECNMVLKSTSKFCSECGTRAENDESIEEKEVSQISNNLELIFPVMDGLNSTNCSIVELGNQIENITMSSKYRSVRVENSIIFFNGSSDTKLWELKGFFNKGMKVTSECILEKPSGYDMLNYQNGNLYYSGSGSVYVFNLASLKEEKLFDFDNIAGKNSYVNQILIIEEKLYFISNHNLYSFDLNKKNGEVVYKIRDILTPREVSKDILIDYQTKFIDASKNYILLDIPHIDSNFTKRIINLRDNSVHDLFEMFPWLRDSCDERIKENSSKGMHHKTAQVKAKIDVVDEIRRINFNKKQILISGKSERNMYNRDATIMDFDGNVIEKWIQPNWDKSNHGIPYFLSGTYDFSIGMTNGYVFTENAHSGYHYTLCSFDKNGKTKNLGFGSRGGVESLCLHDGIAHWVYNTNYFYDLNQGIVYSFENDDCIKIAKVDVDETMGA